MSPPPDGERGLAPLALSTMYAQRFPGALETDLAPFFEAGRAMGFDRFELSHIVGSEALERVVASRVPIASVHHPCPAAPPAEPSSPDRRERAEAARSIERSSETAARVGAPIVVLHLGSVPDPDGRIAALRFELTARFHAGQVDGRFAEAARARLLDHLDHAMPAACRRAVDCLEAPMERARALGVRLAVETGYHPNEVPDPDTLRELLTWTDPDVLGAWLDTGHVAARAALEGTDERRWWTAASGRWLGAHLHDAVGLRDHLAPGIGTIDFRAALAQLPSSATLTCEVDWYLDPSEVVDGARHVLDRLPQVVPGASRLA